jgi:hypothetical protein
MHQIAEFALGILHKKIPATERVKSCINETIINQLNFNHCQLPQLGTHIGAANKELKTARIMQPQEPF